MFFSVCVMELSLFDLVLFLTLGVIFVIVLLWFINCSIRKNSKKYSQELNISVDKLYNR